MRLILRRFRPVFAVRDLLAPARALALLAVFRHREMAEQAIRGGAVPMHRIGRDHHRVAGIDRLRLRALADADAADAGQTIERLAHRMGMPGGPRPRRERDYRRPHARRRLADEHLVLKHLAGEIVCRAAPCGAYRYARTTVIASSVCVPSIRAKNKPR